MLYEVITIELDYVPYYFNRADELKVSGKVMNWEEKPQAAKKVVVKLLKPVASVYYAAKIGT